MDRDRKIAGWIEYVLLGIAVVLRLVHGYSGPEWTYWYGNIAFGLFLIIPGATILFIPKIAATWLQILEKENNYEEDPAEWTLIDKIYFYPMSLFLFVFGSIVLYVSIKGIIIGCHIYSTCQGLW